jgi:two-component system NtrC family sensor kinase
MITSKGVRGRNSALISGGTARALQERVKELTCLYGISQIGAKPGSSLDEVLRAIIALVPPAWQYAEAASARIVLDGRSYEAPGFREGCQRLDENIVVDGKCRGAVEVIYTEHKPALDEGPFLDEERSLLQAIARHIAFIVERRQAEQDRERLQKQLIHADRLATIGQLSAGVAHELNEPLSSILGFAQLARKHSGLPRKAVQDIRKIEAASLHAREVIRKLLLFARQVPTVTGRVNLNKVVSDALGMFEHRLRREGIEVVRDLCAELPDITADAGQLMQVLVNVIVNAIQAMPQGGTLTIRTAREEGIVACSVEDTGTGMSKEVLEKIFVPFFTTKDVSEGTGLGLPVVHGIIKSHGGTIIPKSVPGRGTTFTIRLPFDFTHTRKDEGGQ